MARIGDISICVAFFILFFINNVEAISTNITNHLDELQLLLGNEDLSESKVEIIIPEIEKSEQNGGHYLLTLRTTNRTFILYLTVTSPLITSPNDQFSYVSLDKDFVENYSKCTSCYLTGSDLNPGYSNNSPIASFTLFDGLRGIIFGENNSYFINPVNSSIHGNSSHSTFTPSIVESPHYFVTLQSHYTQQDVPVSVRSKRELIFGRRPFRYPGYNNNGYRYFDQNQHYNQIYNTPPATVWTKKKLLQKYHVETAVFVDEALYEKYTREYGTETAILNLEKFLFSLIKNVDYFLNHRSLGNRLKLVLVHTEIFKKQPPDLKTFDGDIDGYLNNFCRWQHKRLINGSSKHLGARLHWDHAILLTGVDLHRRDHRTGRRNNSYVGYAYVNGMCNAKYSCTVNEGTSFRGVYVAAHEMGHSMGMTHDGEEENTCDRSSFLMSPSLHPKVGKPKTSWSSCSRKQLEIFLTSNQSRCLENNVSSPTKIRNLMDGRLPGENFTPDQQCRVLCGRTCKSHSTQTSNEICEALVCRKDNKIRTAHQALEGTKCGERKQCVEGKCEVMHVKEQENQVTNNNILTQPSTFWTEWSSIGETCKSSCLLRTEWLQRPRTTWGIIAESRRCSSFDQRFGCEGETFRYRLCDDSKNCKRYSLINIKEYSDRICQQESFLLDQNMLPESAEFPYHDPTQSCQIWCKQNGGGSVNRGWSLPNGTPCRVITPGNKAMCIKGACEQFGCDGLPFKYSDPSKCTEAVRWPTNSYQSVGNFINLPQCSDCLYSSVVVTDSYKTCDSWSCHINLSYKQQKCNCRMTSEEFSTKKCSKYVTDYPLTGYGKVLTSTSGDESLACFVSCESRESPHIFFKMESPLELMPDGTHCGQYGDQPKYCYNGKCLFGSLARRKRRSLFRERVFTNLGDNEVHVGISYSRKLQNTTKSPIEVGTTLRVTSGHKDWSEVDKYFRLNPPMNSRRPLFKWQTTVSKCNRLGERKVSVTCYRTDNNKIIDDVFCDKHKKLSKNKKERCEYQFESRLIDLRLQRVQNRSEWDTGKWSKCQTIDGHLCKGRMNRTAFCKLSINLNKVYAMVGDQFCHSPKPSRSELCEPIDCHVSTSKLSRDNHNEVKTLYIKVQDIIEFIRKYSVTLS